jgi:putative endopeptidase
MIGSLLAGHDPAFRKPVHYLLLAGLFSLSACVSGGDAPRREPGLDLAGMDRSVRPGDDFFRYANGTWLENTPIPADRSSWGSFWILAEEANRRAVDLIQGAAAAGSTDPDARKVGDYYAAFMDEDRIEARGASPLRSELDAIAAIGDKTALARFLGGQLRADVDPLNSTDFHTDRLFGLWVSADFDDPARNFGYLLQGGLGMPDRDYYLASDERSVATQTKYREHAAALLALAGVEDAQARAARIYDLEHKIAATHVSRTDSLDVQKGHNRWQRADFPAKAPGLDWQTWFQAAGLAGQASLMVWHPSAVTGISALVAGEPLEVWKEYLAFHAADRGAPLLSRAFVERHFAFHGTALTGAAELRARWKRGVDATNGALGDAVGKLYVGRYFPPEAKARAQEMVKDIAAAFGRRVDRLDWMSPATRAKAKAKLETLYVGIGYPDVWRDYSTLAVARDDAFGNAQRASLFEYRRALAKLGRPVDKKEWWMTPQTVNAVNLPLQNALNFPAAILQPPFFDSEADAAQNYGGIGTVIGHEISHSFDDQGSQFDAQGRLANWWTEEDLAHFNAASQRLVAQYDGYQPLPGSHLNGKLTLSENIADVAGLAVAYEGYRAACGDKEGPATQGFHGDQRFFLSFGQIWRGKLRPEALRQSLLTNGHAPGEFRAATVRNLDAWYETFGVESGQRLYLAPKDRIRIW